MILAHQPTIFPTDVLVRVSSAADGTMLDREKHPNATHDHDNRRAFCRSVGINYDDVVYQMISYGDMMTYNVLNEVGAAATSRHADGVIADGLVSGTPGVGLMLPVADCVATVIYDRHARRLYLLHLGRHSTLTSLLRDTLASIINEGASPDDIFVWMSPHAGKDSYVMQYFEYADHPAWQPYCHKRGGGYYLDLAGFNRQICLDIGVSTAQIEVSEVDTVTSEDYYSHSGGDTTKRFAVIAMMRP